MHRMASKKNAKLEAGLSKERGFSVSILDRNWVATRIYEKGLKNFRNYSAHSRIVIPALQNYPRMMDFQAGTYCLPFH